MKAVKSGGNVFADIGFDPAEAEVLSVKADLLTLLARAIAERRLTQQQAAALCGIDQGTLSKALGGKLASITIDRLARWLAALGWEVRITATPRASGGHKRMARGALSVRDAG